MRGAAASALVGPEGLAVNVLKQAVTDAEQGGKMMRTTLMLEIFKGGHRLWCEILDVNPDSFEDRIFKILDEREEDKDGGI